MKERPILFSGPMVRAILDGRKTQTRRVVKLPVIDKDFGCELSGGNLSASTLDAYRHCPYGKPVDRLWVRETWRTGKALDGCSPKVIAEQCIDAGYKFDVDHPAAPIWYEADGKHRRWGDDDEADFLGVGKTRVSIHMPRWASRITLEITGVSVERLNEISEEDALAEGIEPTLMNDARTRFINLWTSINGDGSWDANPFVWVIEFKRVTP